MQSILSLTLSQPPTPHTLHIPSGTATPRTLTLTLPSNCCSFKASVCIFWALLFISEYHTPCPCQYLLGPSHLIYQFNYQLMSVFPKPLGTLASFKLSNFILTLFSTHIKLIIAFHACFFLNLP